MSHQKTCIICLKQLALELFGKRTKTIDGHRSLCKVCERQQEAARILRRGDVLVAETKRCFTCCRVRTRSFFYRLKNSNDGLKSSCKECEKLVLVNTLTPDPENQTSLFCPECKETKKPIHFSRDKYRRTGYSAYCKPCRRVQKTESRDSLLGCLDALYRCAKKTADHRAVVNNGMRVQAGFFEISPAFLKTLYDKQDGKCYYSGLEMTPCRKSNWQISLERLDPSLGYIESNCALVCYEFNGFNNWSLEKIEQIDHLRSLQIEIPDFSVESLQSFKKGVRTDYVKCYNASPRGILKRFIISARSSAKIERYPGTFDYNFNMAVAQYKKQGGKCFYSGIPLRFAQGDFRVSPERLDPKKTYTESNVVLVCQEFNLPNTAAWSVEKFAFFLANRRRHENVSNPDCALAPNCDVS